MGNHKGTSNQSSTLPCVILEVLQLLELEMCVFFRIFGCFFFDIELKRYF